MATVTGGTGNDTLNGTYGGDSISGNAGNDRIVANDGNDTSYGGAGADTIFGGNGSDLSYGGTENDWIDGGSGNDTTYGGGGDDTLVGSAGNDVKYGGDGNDLMLGADDTYDDFYGGAGDDTIQAGAAGDDWAWGESGNDSISMGAGNDLAFGGSGADTLNGQDGNDRMYAGSGNDSVSGGQGQDSILGGAGADTVYGGTESDLLEGGTGADLVYGGSGNDTLRGDYTTTSLAMHTSGAAGAAKTVAFNNPSTVPVDLYWIDSNGSAVFMGNVPAGGSTSFNTFEGHTWAIYEAGTTNLLDIVEAPVPATYSLDSNFNDTLHGDDGNDLIYGDLGDDLIYGGNDSDSIYAGVGNDTVFGGNGDDLVNLGDGNDSFGNFSDEGGNDTVYGGAGNDSIITGSGDDLAFGGAGDDNLSAGIGSDSLYGGSGNDWFSITDDHGFDHIEGGADFDSVGFYNWLTTQGVVVTFSGTDTGSYSYVGTDGYGNFTEIEQVAGTDHADTINAAADQNGTRIFANGGDDDLTGGSGADHIDAGSGADMVSGGAGHDSIFGGSGNDTLHGGDGDDSATGGADEDVLSGGEGNDTLLGESGDDQISGGAGNDRVDGGAGRDSLDGGDGSDAVWGGDGADTLRGGAGSDTLTGGEGADSYGLDRNGGADRVTDFDTTVVDGRTLDQLDVSDLRDLDGNPVNAWDVVVSDDGFGNAVLTFPEGEEIVLEGVSPAEMQSAQAMHAAGIPCFTPGARVLTDRGEVPVEWLRPGDHVQTADDGMQPICWIGRRTVSAAQLAAHPALIPVLIPKGAMGNPRQMLVSPQHRFVLRNPDLVGAAAGESFAKARLLVDWPGAGARLARGVRQTSYIHLMLERHQVIFADGCATESLYPGLRALRGMTARDRAELFTLFPVLRLILTGTPAEGVYGTLARPAARQHHLRRYRAAQ